MKTKIFHTVNCGLYFRSDQAGLLTDGFHQGYMEGFSNTPTEIIGQMKNNIGLFQQLNGVVFTHLHLDHFDRPLLQCALNHNPKLLVYGPGLDESNIVAQEISHGFSRMQIGPFHIMAVGTRHDGKDFHDTAHQSFFIQVGEEGFFLAGDAFVDEELAKAFAAIVTARVTVAFINVYHALSPGGRAFLRSLGPDRVCLYHLPFPEHDLYRYWNIAQRAIDQFPKELPSLELPAHMSWLHG